MQARAQFFFIGWSIRNACLPVSISKSMMRNKFGGHPLRQK